MSRKLKEKLPFSIILMSMAIMASTAMCEETHPSIELPPDLARVLTDYEAAWANKDAVALAALFTDDGFVLSQGRPPVRGRDAIQRRYAKSGGALALRALAFATEGSLGYIVGAYSRHPGEPDLGKFTLTLRKDSQGRWWIFSDMDNSNKRQ